MTFESITPLNNSDMSKSNKTDILKKAMLQALELSLGVVSTAAKKAGIHRSTHYDWLANDEEYKKAVKDIEELALDFGESKLHEQMNDGNVSAIIFFMKTKGKRRGYVERQEFEFKDTEPDLSGLSTDEIRELLSKKK